MKTSILIFIVVFIVFICLFYYKFLYSHNAVIGADTETLRATIKQIFKEAEKSPLSQNRLIKELKQKFHISEKVALVLISRARQEKIINIVDGQCTLAE